MRRAFCLGLIAASSVGCGALHELKPGNGKSKSGGADAEAALNGAPTQTYYFTASYTQRPVDFIIIRDPATRQDPFSTRIDDMGLVLGARLWNLGSVHVGVFDNVFDPNDPNASKAGTPTTATPIADKVQTGGILDASALAATDFQTALSARIAAAGNRGGTYEPASTLVALPTEAAKANGGLIPGLLRPEAFWSILYMSASLNPNDPYDTSDVLAALKGHAGNYVVSALAVDEGGCVVVDTNPPMLVNKNKAPQRDLEIKMQQATQGLYSSICTNSTYALFADDLVNHATGTDYFPVTLPNPVVGSSIQITVDGTAVPEYRYVEGSTVLEVSTLVTTGKAFQVSAQPSDQTPTVDTGTAPDLDNVPQVGETQATPAELAFLTNVQPSIAANCGSCHAGGAQSYNSDLGYQSALVYKTQIATNLALPLTDPNHMPQQVDLQTKNPTAYNAIYNWAKGQ